MFFKQETKAENAMIGAEALDRVIRKTPCNSVTGLELMNSTFALDFWHLTWKDVQTHVHWLRAGVQGQR